MSDDIFTAAETNNVKRLEELIQDGAHVNEPDSDRGNTPIHWACAGGNLDAIEVLLEYGADINASNNHGRTPLHCLISERYDKIALWLVQYCGADPYIQDKRGVAAFDLAQKFFQPEIESAVKNRQSNPTPEDDYGDVGDVDDAQNQEGAPVKIYTRTGAFKVVKVTDEDTTLEVIQKVIKASDWPLQFTRSLDLYSVTTKRVGTKKYRKQVQLPNDAIVADVQKSWPTGSPDLACNLMLSVKADAPTRVHVAYDNLLPS